MSGEDVRRVSFEDIRMVQNLIERCLQRDLTRDEVMNTLLVEDKIEPVFTELVWQKLEEQNPDFFEAYHFRLLVKEQEVKSNRLLERKAEIMNQLSVGRPTGSHIPLSGEMLESQSQPINNNTFLGSDVADDSLTANIALGSDIWESYCRSPFLTAASDSFLDSQLPGEPQVSCSKSACYGLEYTGSALLALLYTLI